MRAYEAQNRSRSSNSSGYNYNYGYGTGSNPNINRVDGYVRDNGTYVQPLQRTNPNSRFENNHSTKPNYNPYNGTTGTRVTPPQNNYAAWRR